MKNLLMLIVLSLAFLTACGDEEMEMGLDPDTAPEVSIDRFSSEAGMLMVRENNSNLPDANEAIDFDSGEPFITQGLGPDGNSVQYYNFDVQSTTPAPIYAFFDEDGNQVDGQLNIVGVIPGDNGYNDFWQVNRVVVPDDYVTNTIHNEEDLLATDYEIEETTTLVNCPIVPNGSTAEKRFGSSEVNSLHRGWYKDQVVYYFTFMEKALETETSGDVPLSPIYVTFNLNPEEGNPATGPGSGFKTEDGSSQTHNVLATIPSDNSYSPLWTVNVYDNADFDMVEDFSSISDVSILANGVATVNCPVVHME